MKATIHYKSGMTLEVELGDGGLQVRGGESKSAGPLRSIGQDPEGREVWIQLSEVLAIVPGEKPKRTGAASFA